MVLSLGSSVMGRLLQGFHYFSCRTSLFTGVSGDRSRLAQQPAGLGLEGSEETTQHFAVRWEKGVVTLPLPIMCSCAFPCAFHIVHLQSRLSSRRVLSALLHVSSAPFPCSVL